MRTFVDEDGIETQVEVVRDVKSIEDSFDSNNIIINNLFSYRDIVNGRNEEKFLRLLRFCEEKQKTNEILELVKVLNRNRK